MERIRNFMLCAVCLIVCATIANSTSKETVEGENVVRQCRCGSETEDCFANLGGSFSVCNEKCADLLQPIGDPEKLMQCFVDQQVFGKSVKTCVLKNGGVRCYEGDPEPPLIHRVDLKKQLEVGLGKASKLETVLSQNPLLKNLTNVIETLGEYARCLNNCSDNDRQEGSCFSDNGCQLKKDPADELFTTVFQCAITLDHGQIVDTCNCFANAGVSSVASLCDIIGLYLDKSDFGSGLDKKSFEP